MSNIVERLRSPANVFYEYAADNGAFLREAADEITRLRADLAAVTEERDALLARLAPVEDEELVEIAAYYFTDGSSWSALSERLRNICRRDARNVIADIRPHIEAAERERCAKIAEGRLRSVIDLPDGFINWWERCQRSIAAAIRSGK